VTRSLIVTSRDQTVISEAVRWISDSTPEKNLETSILLSSFFPACYFTPVKINTYKTLSDWHLKTFSTADIYKMYRVHVTYCLMAELVSVQSSEKFQIDHIIRKCQQKFLSLKPEVMKKCTEFLKSTNWLNNSLIPHFQQYFLLYVSIWFDAYRLSHYC